MIDLSTVIVRNSDPNCLKFLATATLQSFGLVPGEMTIRSSGAERWPAVAIDASGELVQAATLWVFLKIDGQWYATGAERLRPSQVNGGKPEGAVDGLIGRDWLFDANRWQEMASYNPAPGETIGVMLVAGDTRGAGSVPVQERSNVLEVRWPISSQGSGRFEEVWREGQTADAPPSPFPTPIPPSPPDVSGDIITTLAARLAHIEAMLVLLTNTSTAVAPTKATGYVDIKYIGKAPVTLTLS